VTSRHSHLGSSPIPAAQQSTSSFKEQENSLRVRFLTLVNRSDARIGYGAPMTDSVARLYNAVIAVRGSDPAKSRTARLLRSGRAKMAKKLAEEAVEVVIDAMHGQTEAVVRESADLIYNLVVLWVHAGVHPDEVWAEMRRRELMFGIAEKVPKDLVQPASRRKVVALETRRIRKRR
jgi:phosphoribosyl-ATP pyrophosphohydrolase